MPTYTVKELGTDTIIAEDCDMLTAYGRALSFCHRNIPCQGAEIHQSRSLASYIELLCSDDRKTVTVSWKRYDGQLS